MGVCNTEFDSKILLHESYTFFLHQITTAVEKEFEPEVVTLRQT